jgi:SAM-dependent methyltransferase
MDGNGGGIVMSAAVRPSEPAVTGTRFWKSRLYDAYVSSGQAAPRQSSAEGADADASVRRYAPHLRQFIARHIPPDRSARIVDLGCGDGIFLHYLRDAGYRNTAGVDVSPEQIARAHRLGLTDVRHADIDGFLDETAASSVDVVLLMDVLEHLTREELFRTLDGVVRVLANGGVCIAHMPNAEGLFGMRIRYGDFTHEQAFTAQSSRQVFRAVGFSRVSCHEDKPVVHGPISFARRVIWDAGTLPYRVLLAAETGSWGAILSQNLLVRAVK